MLHDLPDTTQELSLCLHRNANNGGLQSGSDHSPRNCLNSVFSCDEQSLVRVVASEKYRAGLDSTGRHQTVTDAFEVRLPRLIAQETVLLIDDVLTTGATASSCAAALVKAGAISVQVLTIARPG